MSNNGVVVFHHSRAWYHFILFISFILAVISIPYLQNFMNDHINQEWLVIGISYVISYFLAVKILPELGFWIYKINVSGGL